MDKEVFYNGLSFTKDSAIQAIEDLIAKYLRSKKGDLDFYQSHRYAYDLISLLTDNQLIDFNESSAFLEKLIHKPEPIDCEQEQQEKNIFYKGQSFTLSEAIQAIEDHTVRFIFSEKNDFDHNYSFSYARGLISLLYYQYKLIDSDQATFFSKKLILIPDLHIDHDKFHDQLSSFLLYLRQNYNENPDAVHIYDTLDNLAWQWSIEHIKGFIVGACHSLRFELDENDDFEAAYIALLTF